MTLEYREIRRSNISSFFNQLLSSFLKLPIIRHLTTVRTTEAAGVKSRSFEYIACPWYNWSTCSLKKKLNVGRERLGFEIVYNNNSILQGSIIATEYFIF